MTVENSGNPKKAKGIFPSGRAHEEKKKELVAGLREHYKHEIIAEVAQEEAERIRGLWERNGRNCTIVHNDGRLEDCSPFENLPKPEFVRPKKLRE
ncbi:MAG: hypothetical protein WCX64_05070 [Candidatus Micrarchaeia archaeon]